jgi:hypothetical protein
MLSREALTASTPACGFQGNPDLYGLGIRLGVYLQWISAFIVYQWYPKGREELTFAYTVFIVALSITTIVLTTNAHSTYTAEVFILMLIVFGGAFTTVFSATRAKFSKREFQPKRHYAVRALFAGIYTLLLAVTAIYSSWFWIRGIHHDFNRTPGSCTTHGFLIIKANLYRPAVSRFLATVSIIASVFFGLSLFIIIGVSVARDGSVYSTRIGPTFMHQRPLESFRFRTCPAFERIQSAVNDESHTTPLHRVIRYVSQVYYEYKEC